MTVYGITPGANRGTTHAYNIHNEQSVVLRLIRLIEEMLECEDAMPHSDLLWYRNRLQEIKREVNHATGAPPTNDGRGAQGVLS